MSYRPGNLKNPYPNPECDALTEEHLIQAMEYSKSNYEIYEEALDAMLAALKNKGEHFCKLNKIKRINIPNPFGSSGWVILIPDEEEL